MFRTILQEATQDPIALLLGEAAGCAVFRRQRGGHFSQSDLGKQDRVLRLGIGEVSYPRAPRFISVAFHHGTGIKGVRGHGFEPRWSCMMPLSTGPVAWVRIMRTSSSVTPGMILRRRVALRGRRRPAASSPSQTVRDCAASRA